MIMRSTRFILLSAVVFAMPGWAATPGEIEVGAALRDVPMAGFAGEISTFSEFRGKPLVINVWASWCGPCRAEMGSLERLSQRYGGKQFNVIGISTDDDAVAAAAFLKKSGISFVNFLDRAVVLENMLGANTIPLTVLVDANGRVLKKLRGFHEWDGPEALRLIGEAFHLKM